MENNEKKNITEPMTFRVAPEDKQKFQEFSKENRINQAEMFDALIKNYEMAQAKNAIPERAKEIETFQDTLNKISGMFTNSLEINQTSEARIRDTLNLELTTKDQTISDLQKHKEHIEIGNGIMAGQLNTLEKKVKEYELMLDKSTADLNDKYTEISQQREQINALTILVAESQGFRDENKALTEANRNLITEQSNTMAVINNLKNELASARDRTDFYKKEVESSKQEKQDIRNEQKEQLRELGNGYKKEIDNAQMKYDIKYNNDIKELKAEYKQEILELKAQSKTDIETAVINAIKIKTAEYDLLTIKNEELEKQLADLIVK